MKYISTLFLWVACKLNKEISATIADGIEFRERLREQQHDDTVRGMGWMPVPYNVQSRTRVTLEHFPEMPEENKRYCALVDYRDGIGLALHGTSWADIAHRVMIVIDAVDDELEKADAPPAPA